MLLHTLYLIGITAEAMTGALAAGRRRMDTFGVIIIATATALGGGSVRDILLGHYPLGWVIPLEQREQLERTVSELKQGLLDMCFLTQPAALFRLRIALAESAAKAVHLELQASGGKAYLSEHGSGFARRWRESAFVPIVTPSLVQLRTELNRQANL